MAARLKVALIGAGWVVKNRHIPSLRLTGAAEIIGVIDRTRENASNVARHFKIGHAAAVTEAFDSSWFPSVDVCCIGTPPVTHFGLIRKALEAGKHVITEKPFVLRRQDAECLLGIANERRLILGIVHNFQFSQAAIKLLADIQTKRLGNLTSLEGLQLSNPRRRLPSWYEGLPGGLFFDESPHLLYMLDRLTRNSLHIKSTFSLPSPKAEATPALVTIVASDNSGLPVRIEMNFNAGISEWLLIAHGTEAVGIVDLFRDIYVRLPNDGSHAPFDILRTSARFISGHLRGSFFSGLAHLRNRCLYGNVEVFRRFLEAVRSQKQPEFIGGADAARVLDLQLEALSVIRR